MPKILTPAQKAAATRAARQQRLELERLRAIAVRFISDHREDPLAALGGALELRIPALGAEQQAR